MNKLVWYLEGFFLIAQLICLVVMAGLIIFLSYKLLTEEIFNK